MRQKDKFVIARIAETREGYQEITTIKTPMDTLFKAKTELRLIALTETNAWQAYQGTDKFEDWFNLDKTAWGPVPCDHNKSRYIIICNNPGFYAQFL